MVTKIGTSGANDLTGTSAADTLWGRGGNDTLYGLGGDDKLYGETGKDILKGGLGNDRLDGGAGVDRITYFNDGSVSGVNIYLTDGVAIRGGEIDTLISIEEVYGSLFADYFRGTDFADLIRASYGDDHVQSMGGNDVIYGDDGNDNLEGGDGNDDLQGGAGNDFLYGMVGADFIYGGPGDDVLSSESAGADYARDTLYGGVGNDSMSGDTGFNLLVGGKGDDLISVMGGEVYGDQGPGVRQITADKDFMQTDLGNDYGTPRLMTGGLGADTFWIIPRPEGVATAVTITDFTNGQDRFELVYFGFDNERSLDSNRDGYLDASDGRSYAGNVSVNYDNNSLTLTVGDGDSVTFLNNTHVDYEYLI